MCVSRRHATRGLEPLFFVEGCRGPTLELKMSCPVNRKVEGCRTHDPDLDIEWEITNYVRFDV